VEDLVCSWSDERVIVSGSWVDVQYAHNKLKNNTKVYVGTNGNHRCKCCKYVVHVGVTAVHP